MYDGGRVTTEPCRICGVTKPIEEMAMRSPVHADTFCKACKSKKQQAARAKIEKPAPAPTPQRKRDASLCPVCGVAQAVHWRCSRPQCESRGHAMGRGTVLPHLCGWCEAMELQTSGKKAA